MEIYIEDKEFKKEKFSENRLKKGEYVCCIFSDCDFSNSDLNQIIFSDCSFLNCNLSMIELTGTTLNSIRFNGCKMLGVNFENCNQFGFEVSFKDCTLNHSIFYKLKLRKTQFINSKFHEVDFGESDLTNSTFENCDLKNTNFNNTIIEGVDFRTAYNFTIDPEINQIKKAKFSTENALGLLAKYNIKIEKI